jgi:hypothetical protein
MAGVDRIFALLLTLSAVALAVGGDPPTLFTHHATAPRTGQAVAGLQNQFFFIQRLIRWTSSTNITNTHFPYNHNNSLVFTS